MLWDVVIAGAGPAGSVAAHLLARAGFHVLLTDSIEPSRHKVGEVLPGAACRLLRSLDLPGPERSGAHRRIVGTLSSWESSELLTTDAMRSPDGPSWRLDRMRFDQELRDAAVSSGAVVRLGRLRTFNRRQETWDVKFDDGSEVAASWLVDATGRRAALARALGARRLRDTSQVALYALSRSFNQKPRLERTVIEAASEGWWYAGHLPCGRATAGLHVRPDLAAPLIEHEAWMTAWKRTQHVRAYFPELAESSLLPALEAGGARLNRFRGDGWIACGDAAMGFDPLSSQGLLTAIFSARLAAEYLLSRFQDASDASGYEFALQRVWELYQTRLGSWYRAATFRWSSP